MTKEKVDTYIEYSKAKHVVVDIETTGTKPGCGVLSIGAYYLSDDIMIPFYKEISLESCHKIGLVDDPDTIKFWMMQKDEVRIPAFSGTEHIYDVIAEFTTFLNRHDYNYIWGNSPDFDLGILGEVYRRAGIPIPWSDYRQLRDIRTLCTNDLITKEERDAIKVEIKHTPHHALSDAALEAKILSVCIDRLATIAATLASKPE